MTYPEVQFVAAPEDGAEVLFDFNDNIPGEAPAQIVAGSFTLGTPEIIGDPDGLGVQYGSRTVGFSLLIYGNRHAAKQTQALLARTFMLRRRGWLRVKLDEFSAPVWLRTYTPTPAELDFSLIAPDSEVDAWQLEVEVAAEPFIRGERIELWSGTINEDPAAGTNPMQVMLPPVVGDAPAPLRIEASFSGARDLHDVLFAVSAVPDSYTEPIVWEVGEGDGWSFGSDTTGPLPSATTSGGTYRETTFAAVGAMAPRFTGEAPAAPPPGRYKVLLRVGQTTSGSTFRVKLGYQTAIGQIYGAAPTTTVRYADGYWTWVDLGDFDFPLADSGIDMDRSTAAPSIALAAERLGGTDSLRYDCFLLIPIDVASVGGLEPWEKADVLVSAFNSLGPAPAGGVQVWDGDAEASAWRSTAGVMDGFRAPATRGAFPRVRPGSSNLLTLVQQVRPVQVPLPPSPATLTSSATVTVSYQPRWLWLGDA